MSGYAGVPGMVAEAAPPLNGFSVLGPWRISVPAVQGASFAGRAQIIFASAFKLSDSLEQAILIGPGLEKPRESFTSSRVAFRGVVLPGSNQVQPCSFSFQVPARFSPGLQRRRSCAAFFRAKHFCREFGVLFAQRAFSHCMQRMRIDCIIHSLTPAGVLREFREFDGFSDWILIPRSCWSGYISGPFSEPRRSILSDRSTNDRGRAAPFLKVRDRSST